MNNEEQELLVKCKGPGCNQLGLIVKDHLLICPNCGQEHIVEVS